MTKEGLEHSVWIETLSGLRVSPLHMSPEDINIKDIAYPLSHVCRFAGQCRRFYSVGQHSILVADLVADMQTERMRGSDWEDLDKVLQYNRTCLAALLHDAPEAYISDVSRPVKYSIKGFKEIENVLMGVVVKRFGLSGADWQLVHKADDIMLATEAYQLMPSKGEGWYLPEHRANIDIPLLGFSSVVHSFMQRFDKYGGK